MNLARSLPPWLWLILVILYFLVPVDIFPDFLGLPGRVDDFLVALVGLYFMYANSAGRKRDGKEKTGPERSRPGKESGNRDDSEPEAAPEEDDGPRDPYDVLGVPRDASLAEIRRRYRERLLEVHPDRVEHLGGEFRELAEQKTRELNEAFQHIQAARERKP